jgi:arylsulfatase
MAAALLAPGDLPSLSLVSAAQAQEQTKPNILVIMADDVGWMNVSSYGGDIMGVSTPNIDRIGAEGLRLTSFYGQPSCTAGRAAFLTGQLPVRTGLTTVGTPGSPAGLQAEDVTIAEVLKGQGYATAQFGKNHLGDLDEHLPCNHGFDEYFGNLYHLNANEDLEDPDRPTGQEFRAKFDPRGVVSCTTGGEIADEGPLTVERMARFDEEVVTKSLAYLDARAQDDQPFFLWHNPTRMHVFIHLQESRQGVSRAGSQDIYGDGLAELDDHVGQLLAKLDETGLDENTIVIFTTDNGAAPGKFGALKAAPRRIFPFGFGRQVLAGPLRIGQRVLIGDVDDRVVLFLEQTALGTERALPVGALDKIPPPGRISQVHRT